MRGHNEPLTVKCHGCGNLHTVTGFVSSPIMLRHEDGLAYGAWACTACRAIPGLIRRAFDAIMANEPLPYELAK